MNFRILGPIEVLTEQGGSLTLGKRLERALLAILLLRAREVCTTDQLIEALWPDGAPARPDASLHSIVARLRRSLEPDRGAGEPSGRLIRRSPGYVLLAEDHEIDARRFEQQAHEGHRLLRSGSFAAGRECLTAALQEWNGPALAEFAYDPFADREAARLEELRLAATEDELGARLALGEQRLVPELEQAVASFPFRENFWAYLLLALYRDGRQTDALRRAGELRHILSEVGLDPSPRLFHLEAAILEHDPLLDTSPEFVIGSVDVPPHVGSAAERPATPAEPALPRWWSRSEQFIGRDRELGRLAQVWDATCEGDVQAVAIVGEAGIGKSSLTVEAAQAALAGDGTVLVGRCAAMQNLPYAPFVEALGKLVASLDDVRLAALGEQAGRLALIFPASQERLGAAPKPSGSGDVDQYLLFEAVAELFAQQAEHAPILLVVDDLQWADDATLHMLDHLLHADQVGRLLVVATIREADLAARPTLRSVLDQWLREHLAAEVRLGGLEPVELAKLIDPDKGEASSELVSAIHRATGGNPFFAVEALRAVGDEVTALSDGAALPQSVQALVRTRLEHVSASCRGVLEVAALLEQRIDVDLLAQVFDEPTAIHGCLDEAVRAGLLLERSGALAFRHDLVRASLYTTLGPAERALRHRQIANALLERASDPAQLAAELAYHFVAAAAADGDATDAVRYTLLAGREAIKRLAYDSAVSTFEAGIATLAAGPVPPTDELDLRLAAAEARRLNGDADQSIEHAADALDLVVNHGDLASWRQVAFAFVHSDLAPGVDAVAVARGLRRIEDAMRAIPGVSAEDVALVHLAQASVAHHVGQVDQAIARMTESLAELAAGAEPRYLVAALDLALGIEGERRPMAERAALVSKMLDAVEQDSEIDTETRLLAYSAARWTALNTGQVEEALRFDELLAVEAEDLAMPRYLAGAAQRRAMLALVRGRHAEAETYAAEALVHRPDDEFFEGYAGQLAVIRLEQGRAHELVPALEDQGPDPHPTWVAGGALVLAEVGDIEAAQGVLDGLLEELPTIERDITWLGTLALMSHVVDLVRDPDGAKQLIVELRDHASRVALGVRGAVCFGPVHLSLGELYGVLGDLEAVERHLHEADRVIDALGAASLQVRRELLHAEVLTHQAPERHDEALAHARRAVSIMEHLRFGGGLAAARDVAADPAQLGPQVGDGPAWNGKETRPPPRLLPANPTLRAGRGVWFPHNLVVTIDAEDPGPAPTPSATSVIMIPRPCRFLVPRLPDRDLGPVAGALRR